MTVTWRAAARADVIRIVHYIAAETPVAARQVARELVLAAREGEVTKGYISGIRLGSK